MVSGMGMLELIWVCQNVNKYISVWSTRIYEKVHSECSLQVGDDNGQWYHEIGLRGFSWTMASLNGGGPLAVLNGQKLGENNYPKKLHGSSFNHIIWTKGSLQRSLTDYKVPRNETDAQPTGVLFSHILLMQ